MTLIFLLFSECPKVSFINSVYYPELVDGVYHPNGETCDGRDVYQHSTSDDVYMFHGDDEYWYIANGSYVCFFPYGRSYFIVDDSAQYPEYITNTWNEYYDGMYRDNYNADVSCSGEY